MTLFTTLLVLIFERLFKLGEHWQLDHRLEAFFRRVKHFSLGRTLGMTIIAMGVTFLLLRALQGVLFNVPTLLVWLLIGLLCIGAGKVRLHYHAYLTAASRNDSHARATMVGELTMIHGARQAATNVSICVSCKMHCCGLTFVFILHRCSG
ncbi:AmpE protein [Escherichia coli]|nr:AmpE protein [Escherichia coli]SRY85924.1 AmpE protein [Escherichia coli]